MSNLEKVTTRSRAIYLAYDHGFEHGPQDLLGRSIDPEYVLGLAFQGGYNAIVLHKGLAEKYYPSYRKKLPLILKLNGKTNLGKGEPFSSQVCSVNYALKLGAAAVGYTIYLGSQYEAVMLNEFGKIQEQARQKGLTVIAWMYPRGGRVENEESPEVTAYGARVAQELGADIVKLKYCGSHGCFKQAVESAGKTKVVLSGGPQVAEEKFLATVREAMAAGAIGVAVGRNVWQARDPLGMTEKIKEIVFGSTRT